MIGHVGWQVQEWAEAANKAAAADGTAGAGRVDAVIFGHSHQSLLERRLAMLYLNPGAAGPRRFNRPRSVARLLIRAAASGDGSGGPTLEAEIIVVDQEAAEKRSPGPQNALDGTIPRPQSHQ